ncbi:prepilin-type N-terminal cleavage/methylation domain-containing protein [Solimicrobium silvestre]|uniref:Prepilin-type N-terminal cleavage/methylation domain n=1 Tax=Solimicrobium silvestre TaxID=2099400 RepID=A0A2S9GTG9_9BURK|nr:prepilin-type N-terminal cleavage/methylation domain-containing protein [Solimicrobium silvestre]PRC91019.1 Prepilin-type N-terminal cleavage/methylation domain [Solimicrobium silvestre]
MFIKLRSTKHQQGFSLLEVLISILIIAIGLLGLSKMQALSIANAQVSGARGLVALQSLSLAAIMHGDKTYWQTGATATAAATTPPCNSACSLSGTTLPSSFGTVASSGCSSTTTACTPIQIAAYDITTWMAQMNPQVPAYKTTITCANTNSATGTFPTTCIIETTWTERQLGMNNNAVNDSSSTTQSYYLYVQP